MADMVENSGCNDTTGKPGHTRDIIFQTAIRLFAERGIEAVPMRGIANAVGIKASSIYSHFASKEYLVQCMYDYYDEKSRVVQQQLAKLRTNTDIQSPREIPHLLLVRLPVEDNLLMTQILHIAMSRMRTDSRANRLVEQVFRTNFDTLRGVLRSLQEQGRIKPVDVDVYVDLYQSICFSASYNLDTVLSTPFGRWEAMNDLFFSLIVPEA